MIEIELTKQQVDLLFPALKQAESAYTQAGQWKACKELDKLYNELYKQIHTYGQIERDKE
ncbi:hypothetical protein UFOVP46_83 [uncultured Caudovirales phage]|uniref:Uncharacterized protein n=1 Tax=uncultured Caudovirales phage TaxID=2100421 RepID=A0A6J5KR37_9CAUD|nr:hypothetical protein UFOVP46_83 [uncultured Caudovirales phage]